MQMTSLYHLLAKPYLFSLDPEEAHDKVLGLAASVSKSGAVCSIVKRMCEVADSRIEVEAFGKTFANPIGLAAGFDKGARAVPLLSALGFGAVEVGTITTQFQGGNPRPRVWRVPEDHALVNALGFPSDGIEAVLPRLRQIKEGMGGAHRSMLGINIGKSKSTPLDEAESEYRNLTAQVRDSADYIVINISSPNTPELRKLQEPARLGGLLTAVREVGGEGENRTPILVKIAPDLSSTQLNEVLKVVQDRKIDGIIATNTTVRRDVCQAAEGLKGGLSGDPLKEIALGFVRDISERTQGEVPIVGVGGVRSVADVVAYLKAGASLVQLYTGLVYEGPFLVNRLAKGLANYCTEHGLNSIKDLAST